MWRSQVLGITVVVGAEADWQWSNLIGNSQTLTPLGAAYADIGVHSGLGGILEIEPARSQSDYFASWKMISSVCRIPVRTRLTPCRRLTR